VTLTLEKLTAELRKRKRSDWSVVERTTRRATARPGRSLARLDDETRITLVVHLDVGRGRGTGELELEGDLGDEAIPIIEAAEARALASIGPAWETPAQAAPARVELVDPAIAQLDDGSAATVLAGLPANAQGEATIESTSVRLATGGLSGRDLAVRWEETRIAVRAVVEAAGRTAELRAEARRVEDLRFAERIRLALAELAEPAGGSVAPGTYGVVLHAAAHAHGGYGVWGAIVAQADAALARQGLSRLRLGEPIAPRAAQTDDPLTITSDGTLAFGVLSAPTGERGEPVRKFAVVDRGVARGLAYDQREAALVRREPNGGIRNLVVAPGKPALAELLAAGGAPIVEVRRLAWLDLDPRSGYVVARIGAGTLRDGITETPIAGGTLRFDAIAALAFARRSAETTPEGPVVGPSAIRFDGLTITD
jgi:predicted Zn-dependent protease